MLKFSFALAVFIFFAFPGVVNAQVVINEFLIEPSPQWVEIYNSSTSSLDVSGWVVDDNGGTEKYTVPSGTILAAGEFYLAEGGSLNLNTASADTVRLFDSSNNLVDSKDYSGNPGSSYSLGRTTDGSSSWGIFTLPTKHATNNTSSPSPIPTSTLTPTPTPAPTSAPTSAPTKTASPTPTSTKTLSPAPTKSPIAKSSPTQTSELLVLGTVNSPSPSPEEVTESAKLLGWADGLPIVPIVLIILGVSTFVGSGVMYLRSRKLSKFERIEIDEDSNEIGQ